MENSKFKKKTFGAAPRKFEKNGRRSVSFRNKKSQEMIGGALPQKEGLGFVSNYNTGDDSSKSSTGFNRDYSKSSRYTSSGPVARVTSFGDKDKSGKYSSRSTTSTRSFGERKFDGSSDREARSTERPSAPRSFGERKFEGSSDRSAPRSSDRVSAPRSFGERRFEGGSSDRPMRPEFSHRTNSGRNGPRMNREEIKHSRYIYTPEVIETQKYIPTKQFGDFALLPKLQENLTKRGYTMPTEIQEKTIESALSGKDVMGLAKTGSGKTGGFLIPLINRLAKEEIKKVLIMVPTRELANQIEDEFFKFSHGLRQHSVIVIGGASYHNQIFGLKRNPHFVIGTPGRLLDLHERKAIDFSKFDAVVLDEVDRMLDMGFVDDMKFVLSHMPESKQVLFFSATMDYKTESIAKSHLKNPVIVRVMDEQGVRHIHQDLIKVNSQAEKYDKLKELLEDYIGKKVLIFVRTKHGADDLSDMLYSKDGIKSFAIHSEKSQNKREQIIDMFKKGHSDVLIGTDVVARGLDVSGIQLVVNYDEPENFKDYTHRIGRTGRNGAAGKAITLVVAGAPKPSSGGYRGGSRGGRGGSFGGNRGGGRGGSRRY